VLCDVTQPLNSTPVMTASREAAREQVYATLPPHFEY
jgi:hypothetical protein